MNNNRRVWGLILWLFFSISMAALAEESGTNTTVLIELTIGRILHVNTNYDYVILQCGSLPSPGEEAKVCCGNAIVARLKINSPDRFPFVAADVIEGRPQEGDSVKQVMKKYARSPDDGGKE